MLGSNIPKTLLVAAILLLHTLLAIGAVPSPSMHGSRHRQPVHMRRRSLTISQKNSADRSANASRSQQKQFKIEQPHAPASGKMMFMKRTPTAPLHKRTYTDREIHDNYEDQQHQLEAALQHYVTYGDSDSLQKYLTGFKNPSEKSSSQQQLAQKDQQKSAPTSSSAKTPSSNSGQKQVNSDEECEPEDKSSQQSSTAPQGKHSPQPQQQEQQEQQKQAEQYQQQPQQQQKDDKKQQQSSAKTQDQQQSQSKSQDQQQSQPKSQESQPKPKAHTDAAISQASSGSSGGSNNAGTSSVSVWGYTPPSFDSAAAPATVSLYASSSTPFKGHATFYGTGMGACGIVNSDDQPIVAVSRDIFEQYNPSNGNPNQNSLCGRRLEITWNGKTQQAFAMDECPGCQPNSLDLSPNLFKALDNPDKGVLDGISWKFV